MSSATPGQAGHHSRSNLPTFGNFGNALLERGNPGLRRSTPDSEAMASSDEEVEQSRLRTTGQKLLPNRRSSALTDHHSDNRRGSLTGSNYSGATGSQPNTPGVSQDGWSTLSPSASLGGLSGYPFGTSIWGHRDPPSRLQEVTVAQENRIPFAIPAQPNPSTYRSMSFSVGQTDVIPNPQSFSDNRTRNAPGIQRRTSRQSILTGDGGTLDAVNEADDDGSGLSRDYEALRNGPSLRSSHPARNQPRTVSSSSVQLANQTLRNGRSRNSLFDASEVAIDDTEESSQLRYPARNAPTRRLTDLQSAQQSRQGTASLLSVGGLGGRRTGPQWTTDLDFGALEAIPQSRRHSFADVPTRRESLGSHEDENASSLDNRSQGLTPGNDREYFLSEDSAHDMPPYEIAYEDACLRAQNYAEMYFDQWDVKRNETEDEVQKKLQKQRFYEGRNLYGSSSNFGAYHGTSNMPLHIVNFKCCRSDVFYVQEGTGFQLQPGDLVIVEADRGTDLGTVQHINVSWEEARAYKIHYAEEHYKWLMMFSQQTLSGGPNAENPNPVNPGGRGQQGSGHRESHGDIKPKMIKRLAQPHEFQKLQDKEGNEAKAKRMCQQRVAEHGLNMEILDAEYQMDGKKLTFYYFADTYINFNALVTDLFKLYKTRIWMSAINPASFMTPTSQLRLTPAYPAPNFSPQANQFPTPNGMGYDDPRQDARNILPPRPGFPSSYFGAYTNNPIGNGMGGYPSNMQPPMDPFSNYNPQPYGMFPPRQQPGFGMNRPDNMARQSSANALANQFGSLALGGQDPYTPPRQHGEH